MTSRILISNSHDPAFNLAVEDCIFRSMSADQRVLFLWRNADTVVIGRAQNPWKECNIKKMEQDKVHLARRQSGGGAVFHDLGNTNFTFMAGKPEYNKEISTDIVLQGLKLLGIEGRATGRNDLVVGDDENMKKFSGSAYRETPDRGFHHGTLLLSADLSRLANYLNPDPKKLQSKGITSVRARVPTLIKSFLVSIISKSVMRSHKPIANITTYSRKSNLSHLMPSLTYRISQKNLKNKKAGNGTTATRRSLPTAWMSVLFGAELSVT